MDIYIGKYAYNEILGYLEEELKCFKRIIKIKQKPRKRKGMKCQIKKQ